MSPVEIISIALGVLNTLILIVLFVKMKSPKSVDTEIIKQQIKNSSENSNMLVREINELVINTIKNYNESVLSTLTQNMGLERQQLAEVQTRLDNILKSSTESMKEATKVLENGLDKMQKDNEKKLEEMRATVDEKLNVSLERRMSESFKIINDRLQSVYEGLGEMKQLANGVGDLKKVLTNVKTRGVWGEVSLENLLEQMLSREQYAKQVAIKKNGERVDFVVNLPGKDDKTIMLPIDAKFPIEDYQRLCQYSEVGDTKEVENSLKAIERRIKDEAKNIRDKYIDVPNTTDFAVMYLAIEGLYAEVLRRPGLVETLQQQYKIVICGPTTFSALLNSLQLGFKTLKIEKRSSEIWQLLGAFKQEFTKFVELLNKTQKKLSEASNTIEFATKKSLTIQKKLRGVSDIVEGDEELFINFESENEDE